MKLCLWPLLLDPRNLRFQQSHTMGKYTQEQSEFHKTRQLQKKNNLTTSRCIGVADATEPREKASKHLGRVVVACVAMDHHRAPLLQDAATALESSLQ